MELKEILKNHKKWLNNEGGSSANLRGANLSDVNLCRANLRGADLRDADLRGTDLSSANLRDADLRGADLSSAKNISIQKEWLNKNYKKNKYGYIVYKGIGNTYKNVPKYWEIKKGKYIEEILNMLRTDLCGCGVNFATKEWVKKEIPKCNEIWECQLHWEDLADVCVPYNTDGKARCGRLQLIRVVEK